MANSIEKWEFKEVAVPFDEFTATKNINLLSVF